MIKNLTAREKKIGLITGILIVVFIIYSLIISPLYDKQKKADQEIQSKILFINKYYAILNQKEYYQNKGVTNKQLEGELAQRFLSPSQPSLAAASLQKIVENHAKGNAVNVIQVKIEKPKYEEGLLSIPIRIVLRSDLRNLTQFLFQVENSSKFLVIEEMVIRRVNRSEPEFLETRLLVSGFVQEPQSGKNKKI